MASTVKIPTFQGNQVSCFLVDDFRVSGFNENEVKHDKRIDLALHHILTYRAISRQIKIKKT